MTYLPGVPPVYPAELTVSSDGPAGTAQGSRMGVYLKEDSQQYNNRPVYQKDGGGEYLFYNDKGSWMIGPTASGSNGGITTVQQGLLAPPATGWEYFDIDFREDPHLTVTESSESCPSQIVFCLFVFRLEAAQ